MSLRSRCRPAFILTLAVFLVGVKADAANFPCSGGKSGVEGCIGSLHLCRDGSFSKSQKNCRDKHPSILPRLDLDPLEAGEDCRCRQGRICEGKRGGIYCLNDLGRPSYL